MSLYFHLRGIFYKIGMLGPRRHVNTHIKKPDSRFFRSLRLAVIHSNTIFGYLWSKYIGRYREESVFTPKALKIKVTKPASQWTEFNKYLLKGQCVQRNILSTVVRIQRLKQ